MRRIFKQLFWFWGFQDKISNKIIEPKELSNSLFYDVGFDDKSSLDCHKKLTNQEINFLVERAELSLASAEYEKALSYYHLLLNNSDPHPSYFVNRALIYDNLTEFAKSIEDIKAAIELDPDNPVNYWMLGGYLVSNEMFKHGRLTDDSSKKALKDAAESYRISTKKDPTNQCAWLNIIEINLLTHNWDDAICAFGTCKDFISYLPFKLIRSFLGGLAIILSGEEVDDEDMAIMNDLSIRVSNNHYRACEIESIITEMELTGLNNCRINKAMEYCGLFFSHYDGELRRYGLNK